MRNADLNVRESIEAARKLLMAGDIVAARRTCEAILLTPVDAREFSGAHVGLAECSRRSSDLQGGLEHARAAVAAAPDDAAARYVLALCVDESGDKATAIDELRRTIERQPDFVEAHGALNGGVAAWAIGRRWGIPYMLTEHSTAFAQGRLRWWERDLVRRVIAGAQHCVAVSPQLAVLLSQQYLGSRWEYLPNPLGAAFVEDADARQRDPAAPFVFVCIARLSPEKGHAQLIEAFAAAFAGEPTVRLRLIGDGPMRSELQRLCAAQGIAGQVEFAGVLASEQVRDELAAANAFVLASDVETFGVAVIEALACGCPVLVTASGGPEHLVNAGNGIVIPPQEIGRASCRERVSIDV